MASPYPHYAWAAGHFLLIICAVRYLLATITFKSAAFGWYYKAGFVGALTSYAIVVYKSLGTPQPNRAYVQKALADENFQYFLLAIFWFWSKPISFALIPYAVFSLFHALTFTRTNIIPRIFPAPPVAGQSDRTTQHPIAKVIHAWVKANYDPAMKAVAWTELVIFVRVILGAIFSFIPIISSKLPFKNSLLTPLLFAHFLRLRYFHSAFTRQVIGQADTMVSNYVEAPGTNPMFKTYWAKLKVVLVRWGGGVIEPRANVPAPAAGAAAAGAGAGAARR